VRLGLAAFAVVFATLLVPVAITASWLSLHVDSREGYVDTVAPLADDPELRDALAEEVSAAAMSAIADVVPGAGAFDQVIRTSTREVVENDAFPEFWRSANAKAHREFLAIVHERDEDVVADGWVYIDIGPLLDEVFDDLVEVLPVRIELPSSPVLVPVVRESDLEKGRGAYNALDFLSLWAPLLWLGLVALAVVAAPGVRGRLRTGAACAFGAAIGALLVMLLAGPATDGVVEQVDPEKQDLVRLIVEVVAASLDDAAMAVVIGGLVVGAGLLVGSLWPRRAASAHP
jgi:hypothetical protein